MKNIPYSLGRIVELELRNFAYLGPLREFPHRSYLVSGQAPSDVGTRGERVAEALWFSTRIKVQRERMLRNINEWAAKFGVAKEVRLERLGRSNQYQVIFVDPNLKIDVNLTDVGFGASQLLPIIVQGFYTQSPTLMLIEQPEIHLHPKAQALLGDLFIVFAHEIKHKLIIETHSEHLLARVQRRIAEEKLSPEEVTIYYFDPTERGTQIKLISLDDYGQFKHPLPVGFFEEGWQEAMAHLQAVGKRKINPSYSRG